MEIGNQEDYGEWYYCMRFGIRVVGILVLFYEIGDQRDWGDYYYSMRLGMRKSRNRRDRNKKTEKCRGTEREKERLLLFYYTKHL